MIFSRSILGTAKEDKIKMGWFEYIFTHCIPTGFQSMYSAYINWMDLVWFSDNHQYYTILPDDDPFEQCYLYFWDELQSEVYPKEFLEGLMKMSHELKIGKVEAVPFTVAMETKLNSLLNDIEKGGE